jgi:hypothetical protein
MEPLPNRPSEARQPDGEPGGPSRAGGAELPAGPVLGLVAHLTATDVGSCCPKIDNRQRMLTTLVNETRSGPGAPETGSERWRTFIS